jgi:hypothetical protein
VVAGKYLSLPGLHRRGFQHVAQLSELPGTYSVVSIRGLNFWLQPLLRSDYRLVIAVSTAGVRLVYRLRSSWNFTALNYHFTFYPACATRFPFSLKLRPLTHRSQNLPGQCNRK